MKRKNSLKTIELTWLLPIAVFAVVFVDNLRTFARVSNAYSPSAIESVVRQWQDENGELDSSLRAHYIRLNDDHRLTGTISAIQNDTGIAHGVSSIEVALVRQSRVVSRSRTNGDGFFVSDQLEPGNYTLCVSGDDGFLAYGVQVIQYDDSSRPGFPDPASSGEGQVGGMPVHFGPTNSSNVKLAQLEPAVEITAAVIPPEFFALQRIMNSYVPHDVGINIKTGRVSKIKVRDSVIAGEFRIRLQPDNKLAGRISPLISPHDGPIRLREMNAFLLLDDEIYARANVDDDGNFVFNDIEPNVYGFATAGRDGFAALSFQAIAADEKVQDSASRADNVFQNVSMNRHAAGDTLHVAICPTDDLPYLRTRLESLTGAPGFDEFVWVADALPAGGFGFSGGGISGGNFNSGNLIGAGLGVWLVSEILDDQNRVPLQNPPPFSPFFIRPGR